MHYHWRLVACLHLLEFLYSGVLCMSGFSRFLSAACLAVLFIGGVGGCDRAAGPAPTGRAAEIPGADVYSVVSGVPLQRDAPGVLANDPDLPAGATAKLVVPPRFGNLELNADGSFVYEPKYKFTGRDVFAYQVVTADGTTAPIPVQLRAPNVLVILVDDVGLGDVSAITPEAAIPTPNIDRLAAAGMLFTHAHSPAAVCAPSRYAALTGNYPYRGRLSSGTWHTVDFDTMILPDQQTLGNLFSQAGYRTGYVGKMHLGGAFWDRAGTRYTRDTVRIDFTRRFDRGPTQFGFDYSFVLPAGLSGPPYAFFENDRLVRFNSATQAYEYFDDSDEAASHFLDIDKSWGNSRGSGILGGLIGAKGWVLDNYDSRNVGRILTRRAVAFLEEALAADNSLQHPQPFFLYFTPPQIHTPYAPADFFDPDFPDDTAQASSGQPVAGATPARRLDMLRELDLMVGSLLDYLEERGALENTLVVFSSDNGPTVWENRKVEVFPNPQGVENGIPLRGFKGEMYEGGHRVPLLVQWGGSESQSPFVEPGTRHTGLVGLNDLYATFAAMLGRQRPNGQANDSKSILPVLLNSSAGPVRDHLIVQGSPLSAAENLPYMDRAFYKLDSDGDLWKLTSVARNSDPLAELRWLELYNLSADPGEQTDLMDEPSAAGMLLTMQQEYLQLLSQPQTIQSFR